MALVLFLFSAVVGMESKASCTLGDHSITEPLQPQSQKHWASNHQHSSLREVQMMVAPGTLHSPGEGIE
jgi:hypothetical protein